MRSASRFLCRSGTALVRVRKTGAIAGGLRIGNNASQVNDICARKAFIQTLARRALPGNGGCYPTLGRAVDNAARRGIPEAASLPGETKSVSSRASGPDQERYRMKVSRLASIALVLVLVAALPAAADMRAIPASDDHPQA